MSVPHNIRVQDCYLYYYYQLILFMIFISILSGNALDVSLGVVCVAPVCLPHPRINFTH